MKDLEWRYNGKRTYLRHSLLKNLISADCSKIRYYRNPFVLLSHLAMVSKNKEMDSGCLFVFLKRGYYINAPEVSIFSVRREIVMTTTSTISSNKCCR